MIAAKLFNRAPVSQKLAAQIVTCKCLESHRAMVTDHFQSTSDPHQVSVECQHSGRYYCHGRDCFEAKEAEASPPYSSSTLAIALACYAKLRRSPYSYTPRDYRSLVTFFKRAKSRFTFTNIWSK